jgi:hypothetical protein
VADIKAVGRRGCRYGVTVEWRESCGPRGVQVRTDRPVALDSGAAECGGRVRRAW